MDENVKKFINISIWVAAILFLLRILISWDDLVNMWEASRIINIGYNFICYIGEAIIVAAIVMSIFNKWAWKWKLLYRLHNVPVLAKRYVGELKSDSGNKNLLGEIIIHQTFLTLEVLFKTEESTSRSLTASINKLQSVHQLIYTYQNDPRGELQNRSPIHYGTVILNVNNPKIMEGNYFTSRKSKGSMRFEAVKEYGNAHDSIIK